MTRQETHAQYRAALDAAGNGKNAVLRALALRDLFFLLVYVLGRADADNDFVFARCREVQAAPDGFLDLWAREHFKSTVITFALTIQDILHNPEATVSIFSHTRPIAKGFLRQIKREFEGNQLLKELFPDVLYSVPEREAPQWSEDGGIIVRRKSNPKEATVEAWGLVDGQPTGKHFSLLIYDDVVTRESVTTPDMIQKVTDAWALSLNLGARDGKRRHIGTRYHFNDTYQTIMARNAAIPRLHPATDTGRDDGTPVLLTADYLMEKRRDMGPYIFGCQMLQNPKADAVAGFHEEWLRHWEPKDWNGMNLYIVVDPAGEKKKSSDYTVMWVIGLGPDLNYYLVDGVRDRLNLTERGRALIRLHRQYRPKEVGYEKYGMQADIEYIRDVQNRENYRFSITELGGPMSKNDRIRRLIPLFEQRRFYIPGCLSFRDNEGAYRNLTEEFTREEYLPFPVAGHDDMLDCMARVLDPDLGAVFPEAMPFESRFQQGPALAFMEWRP